MKWKYWEQVVFIMFSTNLKKEGIMKFMQLNLLKTKRNLLYIRNQSVPHSKHVPPQL